MFESGENNPDIRVPVVRNSSGSYDFLQLFKGLVVL